PSRSTRLLRSCGLRQATPKPRSYTACLPETAETCITKGLVCLCVYYLLSNLGYPRPLKKSFTMGFFARWFSNWWRIPLAARDCDGRNGNAPSAKAAGFFSHGYDP